MKSVVLLVLCVLLAVPARSAEQARPGMHPADLPALLRDLGRKAAGFKTLKTDFVQEKKMAMFREKLVLKGRIYLRKPNRVAWHVDSPLRYSVLITDRLVRQWDEETNRVQELSLARNPILQNVLGQLTVWFSGEYGSLLETNDVRVVSRQPLALEFTPRPSSISRAAIRSITITFRDDQTYLQQIRIQELNGDLTTLRFHNTIMNVPLDSRCFEVKGRV